MSIQKKEEHLKSMQQATESFREITMEEFKEAMLDLSSKKGVSPSGANYHYYFATS